MTNWTTEKLADLLSVSIGGIWGEEEGVAEVDVQVVRVTELKAHGRLDPSSAVTRSVTLKQLASRELQEGDLLLEKSGGGPNSPVGRVGYFSMKKERTVCSNFMQLMRPDTTKILPKYLFYFLDGFHSNGGTIPMQTATTNIRNIKTPHYMDIDVPTPSIAEQQKIVEILEDHLSRMDAAVGDIAAAEREMPNLRRALLKSLIFPSRSDGLPAEFIDTDLGHLLGESTSPPIALPIGWKWIKWKDVGTSQNGKAVPSKDYAEEGVRLLRPGNLSRKGSLSWTEINVRRIPDSYAVNFPEFMIEGGDLVMNLTAQSLADDFLGRVCLVSDSDHAFLNQRLARLVPKECTSKFAYIVFSSPLFRSYVQTLNTGSLIQHIYTKQISEFWMPIPSRGVQESIVLAAESMLSILANADTVVFETKVKNAVLRRSLLHAAFTGQLTKEVASV